MKKILLILVVMLIAIQFFQPEKNISSVKSVNHISNKYPIPDNVRVTLEKSCYDCHSNNTRYPWYAKLQPVAWWLNSHVDEGKGEINFDEFLTYPAKKARHKMEEVNEMVKEGEMPLNSYTWVHKEAVLSETEKLAIANWAVSTMKVIEAENNLKPE
jgi:hypothetical protein